MNRESDPGMLSMARLGAAALIALAVAIALALASPGASTACGCVERPGPIVLSGTSPAGMPWRIHVSGPHDSYVEVWFSGGGDGWSISASPRFARSVLVDATTGSDVGPARESDMSGITSRRVRTVVVRFKGGERHSFTPSLAPARVRKKMPWTRNLRFFDQFYEPGARPELLTLLDREGDPIARARGKRGSFFR